LVDGRSDHLFTNTHDVAWGIRYTLQALLGSYNGITHCVCCVYAHIRGAYPLKWITLEEETRSKILAQTLSFCSKK
jgi:hypothetical protein